MQLNHDITLEDIDHEAMSGERASSAEVVEAALQFAEDMDDRGRDDLVGRVRAAREVEADA